MLVGAWQVIGLELRLSNICTHLGGADQPIDVEDLKQNTVYGGWDGDEANDTIRAFWRVVESFNSEDRSKLIRFVTSCARPPLLGFKELNPRFAIRNAGKEQSRLPTSSTCVNMLKLSEFSDEKTLREKLLTSINSGAGFDLSVSTCWSFGPGSSEAD